MQKRTAKLALKIGLTVAALAWIALKVRWSEIVDAVLRVSLSTWALVWAGFVAGHALGVFKWRYNVNLGIASARARLGAMDAAQCIGCGACVASCTNASASLFTSAKIAHLNLLPQGQPEKLDRALKMVTVMNEEKFGSCTNLQECEATCPKGISIENIAIMNRHFVEASFMQRPAMSEGGAG